MFDYAEFTTRNIDFVTHDEQDRLRGATVFVCGTGGMGGACILGLVRAGLGKLIIADLDTFEVSNLNRQVFCFTDTVGQHKADAMADIARKINPEIAVEVHRGDWTNSVDALIERAVIVVNGTDDLGASSLLYRRARAMGKTVIDAYASPIMCYEVVNAVLGLPHGTDNRGYVFNPYKGRTERPKPAFIAALMRPFVRKFLHGLMT